MTFTDVSSHVTQQHGQIDELLTAQVAPDQQLSRSRIHVRKLPLTNVADVAVDRRGTHEMLHVVRTEVLIANVASVSVMNAHVMFIANFAISSTSTATRWYIIATTYWCIIIINW